MTQGNISGADTTNHYVTGASPSEMASVRITVSRIANVAPRFQRFLKEVMWTPWVGGVSVAVCSTRS